MWQKPWFKIIIFLFVLIVLLGLSWWGYVNGQKAAKSKQVVKDVKSVISALEYFKADQNHYPSIDEYADNNIMRNYLSNFPPVQFVSDVCDSSYNYYSSNPQSYELRFCLSKSVSGYKKGWNSIMSK